MNVAVTRAKRLCVLIGDSGTVSKSPFLKELVEFFKDNGIVRSSFDYQGESDVRILYGVAASGQTQAQDDKKDKKK